MSAAAVLCSGCGGRWSGGASGRSGDGEWSWWRCPRMDVTNVDGACVQVLPASSVVKHNAANDHDG
eukprot:31972-Eustigmatos_ZCMA.PRE.1